MKMPQRYLLSLALALTFASLSVQAAFIHSDPVLSRTTSGTLLGQTVQLDNGQLVHRFLGVPYAQAPTGPSRRFELPEPLVNVSSEQILMAQQAKPTCMQMHHISAAISPLLDVDQAHNVSLYNLLL